MDPNFLLPDTLARELYSRFARELPIIDYHNHLPAAALRDNTPCGNITKLWISADPYKHRAMRILGVPEEKITGSASDFEKFRVWYESLPRLVGNPLFQWSQMELALLGEELLPFGAPEEVWERLNARLEGKSLSDILKLFSVESYAPCTALTGALSCFDGKHLVPSLRGDDLLLPAAALVAELEALTGKPIASLDAYLTAVDCRLDAFRAAGCRFADHALDHGFSYLPADGREAARFQALLEGKTLSPEDKTRLSSYILKSLAGLYAKHGFTVQLHMGAQRTTSTRLKALAGAAGGYAAMGKSPDMAELTRFLDDAEQLPQGLPQVLLFPLDPSGNAMAATLCGSYSKDGVEALVSQGPAWWWCDHQQGIFDMLDQFVSHSVLSSFVGMTTDSRSVLSFVRHDYFRRCLCQWMAEGVKKHRLPENLELLGDTIRRICWENAHKRII